MSVNETWFNLHPWMTLLLGMMSLVVINSMFVSMGGGYRKFPPPPECDCKCEKKSKEEKEEDVELN